LLLLVFVAIWIVMPFDFAPWTPMSYDFFSRQVDTEVGLSRQKLKATFDRFAHQNMTLSL
jgi:hypothetical protein